jgi:hypothetical protein
VALQVGHDRALQVGNARECAAIRGQQAERSEVYASDRYDASQQSGATIRRTGGAGILYNSLRRQGGTNIVAHRPTNVLDVTQTDHLEIRVPAVGRRIDVRRLTAP